jgi:tetratricopeptide (TPR) repeat protein
MLHQRRKQISAVVLLCSVLLFSGCAQQETVVRQEIIIAAPPGVEDDVDYGCSYFYFLWGRHAELAGKNNEALEAYEKALICDPAADYIVRKIPLLLLRLDRRDEAITKLEEHLEDHPRESGSRMLLAKIFIRQGKIREAAAQYRKVNKLVPEDFTSLLLLSELYLVNNEKERAQYTLEEVLQIDNRSYPAHILLARLLVSEKKYDKAQDHYQQALLINWSADLQLEMAEGFLQLKNYHRAIQLYRDLLDRDELNESARIALIHVYLIQKRENKALVELNRLKAISSRPERVDLTIARLYARRKDYNKAILLLEDVLKKDETGEARYLLAILHFQTQKYEVTLQDLQEISLDAEEYEDGIFLQVRALRELKRDEQAIELLESAIAEEKGRNPDMYVLLASLYQFNKQKELGRSTFVRGIKAYPNDDKLLYEYGLYLDYRGEHQQAIEVMQQVISLQPEHAAALNYVGYTWADKKIHLDKAFIYIKRAAELKPDNGYIRDSLGWVYYRQGKLEEAIETLEQAVKLSPDDPAILDHLADVYLESGRTADALKTYRKSLELFKEEKDRSRVQEKLRILEEQGKR